MKSLWLRFARDEQGFVVSAELVLVLTVGVLSMLVGLQAVSSAVTQELNDVASAFGAVSQSYGYRSIAKRGHAWVSGSGFYDRGDFCDCNPIVQTDVCGHFGHIGHFGGWGPDGVGVLVPIEGGIPGPVVRHHQPPVQSPAVTLPPCCVESKNLTAKPESDPIGAKQKAPQGEHPKHKHEERGKKR